MQDSHWLCSGPCLHDHWSYRRPALVGCHWQWLNYKGAGVDGDRLGGIVSLVNANEAVRQLKHVIAQADYDELRILGALFDVVRHDTHVLEVCMAAIALRKRNAINSWSGSDPAPSQAVVRLKTAHLLSLHSISTLKQRYAESERV